VRIALVVGVRPNFVKIAPLVHEIQSRHIDFYIIHTGQHYDFTMNEVFFEQLKIPEPDYILDLHSGTHTSQVAKGMLSIGDVITNDEPSLIVVTGDANPSLSGALAGATLKIPVAHVEAGLRSFDRSMPEEVNRVLVDAISDILLASSEDAIGNLRREGVSTDRMHLVGSLMIDTLVEQKENIKNSTILKDLELRSGEYIYVTLHRPSNVDDLGQMEGIASELEFICSNGTRMVFPLHPRTRNRLEDFGLLDRYGSIRGLTLTPPLGYCESLALVKSARLVLTDSGGLEEEALYLRVPCIVFRTSTERFATATGRTSTAIGQDPAAIRGAVKKALGAEAVRKDNFELRNGSAASRIVTIIKRFCFERQV